MKRVEVKCAVQYHSVETEESGWIFHDSCVGRMRCQTQQCSDQAQSHQAEVWDEASTARAEHYRGIGRCQERCQVLKNSSSEPFWNPPPTRTSAL